MKVSIPSRPIPGRFLGGRAGRALRGAAGGCRGPAEKHSCRGAGRGLVAQRPRGRGASKPSHPGARWQVPKSAHVGTRKMVNYARRG